MAKQNGRYGVVQENSPAAIEAPAEFRAPVRWMLERHEFSRAEPAAAFLERQSTQLDLPRRDLGAIRPAEAVRARVAIWSHGGDFVAGRRINS